MTHSLPHDEPRGWYTRGYLPHLDAAGRTQFITFRLYDSLPQSVLRTIRLELELRRPEHINREIFILAERYLDTGIGDCFLRRPEIARIVRDSLMKYNGERYRLHAWVVMPNHVHLLLKANTGQTLERIIHSIKSYTASEANKLLNRKGSFWMREVFDRYIRDEDHFRRAVRYIENNPVKAGLCREPGDWEFSSAYAKD